MKKLLVLIFALFFLSCSIPTQEERAKNRQNWRSALIGESIENVIDAWGIPTGQIRSTTKDEGEYFIYNWEFSAVYDGLLFHSWGGDKPDKYSSGKIASPVCKNVSQKMIKRVWVNKYGKVFKAEWVCE